MCSDFYMSLRLKRFLPRITRIFTDSHGLKFIHNPIAIGFIRLRVYFEAQIWLRQPWVTCQDKKSCFNLHYFLTILQAWKKKFK